MGFTVDLLEVGKKMDSASKSYETAMKKLSTGSGNLVGRVQKLKNWVHLPHPIKQLNNRYWTKTKKMNFKRASYILSILCLALVSCETSTKLSSTDISSMYQWNEEKFNPEYVIYHDNDSSSELYFRFNSEELTYRLKDATKPAEANVKISYTLYDSFESEIIKDSLSTLLVENTCSNSPNYIIGKLSIKAKRDQRYVLRITTVDLYGAKESEQFINVTKARPTYTSKLFSY